MAPDPLSLDSVRPGPSSGDGLPSAPILLRGGLWPPGQLGSDGSLPAGGGAAGSYVLQAWIQEGSQSISDLWWFTVDAFPGPLFTRLVFQAAGAQDLPAGGRSLAITGDTLTQRRG